MGDIDKATSSEPTDVAGRRSVLLDEQWRIGPKMHGGYLLAVLARAAVDALAEDAPAADARAADTAAGRAPTGTPHGFPQAVTGTFLSAPDAGPAVVVVDVLRRGRGVSQVRARLEQDERPCLEAAVVLAGEPATDEVDVSPEPPAVAPFGECGRSPAGTADGRGGLPIMEVVDVRLDPGCRGFLSGRPSGAGRFVGWAELESREPWSPIGLLVALDVLPPASFDLGLSGWSPTMSLTAGIHARPVPGPVRVTQWVEHLAGDRMHESCRVWDASGRMVGHATQLAALRR